MPSSRPVVRASRFRALYRYLTDRQASVLGKLFVLLAVAYVVWPADLVPDVPVVGWLDDLGVMGLATAWLSRRIAEYRESPGKLSATRA